MFPDFPRYSQRSRRRRRGPAVLLGATAAAATLIAIGIAAPDRPSASSRSAAAVGAAASADARPVLVRGGFATTFDRPGLQDTAADLLAGPPPGLMVPPAGLAADLAVRVVAAEGGPDRSSTSSAAGYGQFLRTTWLDVFGRAYPDIARMLSSDQILALRYVKPLALDLTSRYARENAATLVREGLPATDTALSLAHAVGAGGAMTILTASPRAPVADLLSPQAIAANSVFTRMTADDLQGWAANRIGGGRRRRRAAAERARGQSRPHAGARGGFPRRQEDDGLGGIAHQPRHD
jgi:hypothetical protein